MKKIKGLIIFSSLIVLMFILCGCSDSNNNNVDIEEKVIQELEHLDNKMVSMLNKLNNITLENYTILITNRNNIDWNTLKTEIETLNSSWDVIILDLYSLNVGNSEILDFSTVLDSCIISIKNEDKASSLTNLANLYSFIPLYLSSINADVNTQNIKLTKSYIINAYSLVEQDNWDVITKNIQEADTTLKNVTANIEYVKNNEYKVNKTYVLLKELEKSLTSKDKDIFYMKYKNTMESINSM